MDSPFDKWLENWMKAASDEEASLFAFFGAYGAVRTMLRLRGSSGSTNLYQLIARSRSVASWSHAASKNIMWIHPAVEFHLIPSLSILMVLGTLTSYMELPGRSFLLQNKVAKSL